MLAPKTKTSLDSTALRLSDVNDSSKHSPKKQTKVQKQIASDAFTAENERVENIKVKRLTKSPYLQIH